MINILPVLSKVSKFKSNKLRLVPLVDDCGNDVKRSVLEKIFWLPKKRNYLVYFIPLILNKSKNNLHKLVELLFKVKD